MEPTTFCLGVEHSGSLHYPAALSVKAQMILTTLGYNWTSEEINDNKILIIVEITRDWHSELWSTLKSQCVRLSPSQLVGRGAFTIQKTLQQYSVYPSWPLSCVSPTGFQLWASLNFTYCHFDWELQTTNVTFYLSTVLSKQGLKLKLYTGCPITNARPSSTFCVYTKLLRFILTPPPLSPLPDKVKSFRSALQEEELASKKIPSMVKKCRAL